MCYKQKCKVVSLNLAHPVVHANMIGPTRGSLCLCSKLSYNIISISWKNQKGP